MKTSIELETKVNATSVYGANQEEFIYVIKWFYMKYGRVFSRVSYVAIFSTAQLARAKMRETSKMPDGIACQSIQLDFYYMSTFPEK